MHQIRTFGTFCCEVDALFVNAGAFLKDRFLHDPGNHQISPNGTTLIRAGIWPNLKNRSICAKTFLAQMEV